MTISANGQPAITLVDDDYHSARLLSRMLDAHGGPFVTRLGDPVAALDHLVAASAQPLAAGRNMALVDLKASSTATRDFIVALRREAPGLLVTAMAPSLDRDCRSALIDAGATAVFERHADLNLYRQEVANIVGFWVRSQRLDAFGT
ncbi:MAG TPA: hypothetical protein VHZ56_10190 [Devosia sp.]|nr:hypothetical protein [Devosia sp.]